MWPIVILSGLAAGSFLNVVIYRLPRDLSIIKPGSFCPACHIPIKFYDNLPLISYLVLKGRCRYCKAPISWRYPLVELLSASFAGVLYSRLGISPALFAYHLFLSALIVLTFIDLDAQILPDLITMPVTGAGLISSLLAETTPPLNSLIGATAGFGIFFIIAFVYKWVRGREGLGGGDAKLMAMVGAFLGWQGILPTILIGSVSGLLAALILMAFKGRGYHEPIPFGPFLSLGATSTLLWGLR